MSEWAHVTTFSLCYADAERARTVAASLAPEVGAIDDDRSATGLTREGDTVELRIRAADLVSLRAAMNTWLGLVGVAERVADA